MIKIQFVLLRNGQMVHKMGPKLELAAWLCMMVK